MIVALGTSFLLGVGAGLLIESKDWSSFLTSYIPSLATLVAAYYGAKFAFEFQNTKEEKSKENNNINAVNKVIFSLYRMANTLFQYQRDFILPAQDSPAVFLELRPSTHIEKDLVSIDIESLYFLLNTESRNLLAEVMIQHERYRLAIDIINDRSSIHLNQLQPILEKAGFKAGQTQEMSAMEVEHLLGNRLYSTLIESTNNLIFQVDETIESIKSISSKLHEATKTMYPKANLISFKFPN